MGILRKLISKMSINSTKASNEYLATKENNLTSNTYVSTDYIKIHNCSSCKYRECKKVNNKLFIDYCEINKQIFTSANSFQSIDFQNSRNKYLEDNCCRYWEYRFSITWGNVLRSTDIISNSIKIFMGRVEVPEDIPEIYKHSSIDPRVGHYFIDRLYKSYIITSTSPLTWYEMVDSLGFHSLTSTFGV